MSRTNKTRKSERSSTRIAVVNNSSRKIDRNGVPRGSLTDLYRHPVSIVKASAQLGRRDGANIVEPAEYTVANTHDEIVRRIAKRARNDGNCDSNKFPKAAKTAKHVNHALGPNQKPVVACEHDHTVRQCCTTLYGHNRFESGAMQRRESKFGARAVSLDHKPNKALAEAARAVVEDSFCFHHRKLSFFGGGCART
jgi:hypothetical protein